MGLRYDRDSAKRTTGPTIYFTDPTSLIMLTNEIRSTLEKGQPFYVYRRPGDSMITFGAATKTVEGLGTPGFVVAPFLPNLPYLTIPYREGSGTPAPDSPLFSMPDSSTSKEEYAREFSAIQEALEKNGGGKIIAARKIVEKGKTDIPATFLDLCGKHREAFVFCFFTPQTGCWIGASPELLLQSRRGCLSTMALAGSRPAESDADWDEKNIEEQEMVAQFIADTLASHSIKTEADGPFTYEAGKVEHICTLFDGTPETLLTPEELSSLLHDLSPTPALCGLPRETALRVIEREEKGGRGCYGGFCGPYQSPEEFTFHVNLRCAWIGKERYCIFSGGGITLRSDETEEWSETELKASTMRESLCVFT